MIATRPELDERTTLAERLAAARRQTDRLFKLVRPDALYDRPIPERHRIIFYLGHLEAFDWNLLQSRLPGSRISDPGLDRLFAFGIDPVDGGLPSDQAADWPAQPQVERYCNRIRAEIERALEERGFSGWAGDESPHMLLNVAIEHRLMHAETLAYMLHQMPLERKIGESQVEVAAPGALAAGMIEIPAGVATLGISRRDPKTFGWDNEFERQSVNVPAFAIDRYKVTNREYLEFVRAGAYQEQTLWSEAGWNWISQEQIAHPVFWKKAGAGWLWRSMFEEIPLPLDWPVWVSHAEASAYAKWADKRLPTEAEWQRACCGSPDGAERAYPWGSDALSARRGYFDFARWDPAPVNAFPFGASAFGVEGMLANGWEWSSSLFEPFPGFEPFAFYPGYSANFFDGMHYVLKGGSPRTDASMLRRSFRNWFQPHYQYVYAGFRCARG
jgi:ergothioneine biosynthesis protein EgtB